MRLILETFACAAVVFGIPIALAFLGHGLGLSGIQ